MKTKKKILTKLLLYFIVLIGIGAFLPSCSNDSDFSELPKTRAKRKFLSSENVKIDESDVAINVSNQTGGIKVTGLITFESQIIRDYDETLINMNTVRNRCGYVISDSILYRMGDIAETKASLSWSDKSESTILLNYTFSFPYYEIEKEEFWYVDSLGNEQVRIVDKEDKKWLTATGHKSFNISRTPW